MNKRDLSFPMTKQDAYQMSLFAHMEICCNILANEAKPNSRRHNLIKKVQSHFEDIDCTYRGYLPDDWIQASTEFELMMQERLNELLNRFTNGVPVVEPQAPQIPKGKSKVVKSTGGSMQDEMTQKLQVIDKLINTFQAEAAKAAAGNKAAGVRARKASCELGQELKTFRALSLGA